jgi:hypothetical protein
MRSFSSRRAFDHASQDGRGGVMLLSRPGRSRSMACGCCWPSPRRRKARRRRRDGEGVPAVRTGRGVLTMCDGVEVVAALYLLLRPGMQSAQCCSWPLMPGTLSLTLGHVVRSAWPSAMATATATGKPVPARSNCACASCGEPRRHERLSVQSSLKRISWPAQAAEPPLTGRKHNLYQIE